MWPIISKNQSTRYHSLERVGITRQQLQKWIAETSWKYQNLLSIEPYRIESDQICRKSSRNCSWDMRCGRRIKIRTTKRTIQETNDLPAQNALTNYARSHGSCRTAATTYLQTVENQTSPQNGSESSELRCTLEFDSLFQTLKNSWLLGVRALRKNCRVVLDLRSSALRHLRLTRLFF